MQAPVVFVMFRGLPSVQSLPPLQLPVWAHTLSRRESTKMTRRMNRESMLEQGKWRDQSTAEVSDLDRVVAAHAESIGYYE
jgi:hypothetical protein